MCASASLSKQIDNLDRALTAPQLARLLSVDRATVYRAAKSGVLPSFRIGCCVRFDPKAVAAWLRERKAVSCASQLCPNTGCVHADAV